MTALPVPTPPDGYFFRIKPVHNPYAEDGTVEVQLRRRRRWSSEKVDSRWRSPSDHPDLSPEEALVLTCRYLLGDLQKSIGSADRATILYAYLGDHP